MNKGLYRWNSDFQNREINANHNNVFDDRLLKGRSIQKRFFKNRTG